MEAKPTASEIFQPEIYCLVCQNMLWDDTTRRCSNFDGPDCPLTIRRVLAGMDCGCVVV